MEHRKFGRDGGTVPTIGMGTWKTFDVRGVAERSRHQIAAEALAAGASFMDSSPMYGEAERVLGDAVRPVRDQVLVATKVWTSSPEEGRRQIERAYHYFGGRVDLYQVHNLVNWQVQLATLEAERDAGRVRWLGVTGFTDEHLRDMQPIMESGRIDAIQIPYNPVDRRVEQAVLPLAERLGIGVVVMRPLGAGMLARTSPPAAELRFLEPFGVQTWAQALLKWALSDPRISVLIPATSRPGRMTENAAAGDPPWLDVEARERVAHLASRL